MASGMLVTRLAESGPYWQRNRCVVSACVYVCEHLMLTNGIYNTRKHIDTYSAFRPCGYSIIFAESGAIFHNSVIVVE